eukprot:1384095-Pleurochrysis_carterae.AAC.1
MNKVFKKWKSATGCESSNKDGRKENEGNEEKEEKTYGFKSTVGQREQTISQKILATGVR